MGLLANYQQQPVSWNLGTVKRLFGSNSVHKSGFLSLKPCCIVLREHFIQVSLLSTSQTTLKPLRNSYKKQRQGNVLYILSEVGKEFNVCLVWNLHKYFRGPEFLLLPAEPVGYRNIHSKSSVESKNSPVLHPPSVFCTEPCRGDITTTRETFPRETDLCT